MSAGKEIDSRADVGGIKEIFEYCAVGVTSLEAWQGLKPTLSNLAHRVQAKRVLEIGGGRDPLFSIPEISELGFDLIVNDISEFELSMLPTGYKKAVFDISNPDIEANFTDERFELIYSKMVFEHVSDGREAWRNVYRLLKPGGIGFAFVPTLFSPPFVLNLFLPEWLSQRLLRLVDPKRNEAEVPKFKAYYSWCFADESKLKPMLQSVGFREAIVIPFFGTPYFPGVPLLSGITSAFDRIAYMNSWHVFASYAYVIARR